MQVRVGVQSVLKELVVETTLSPEEVRQELSAALAVEHGVFVLEGEKGSRIMIPATSIGYLELGEPEARQVGFGGSL